MFELCILGFLYKDSSYKYEIKKRISGLVIFRRLISDGTIYPIIKRLADSGYIQISKEIGNRQKKLSITLEGKERFLELLRNPSETDIGNFNKFYGYLHFAKHLSVESQIELLVKRITFINDRLPYYMNFNKAKDNEPLGDYFHHQSELLAGEFYVAEMKRLSGMVGEIRKISKGVKV